MTALVPPMPYAGGKQALAPRIATLLPRHHHYVEPYAGGLSVLLAKNPSPVETVNDLNGDLITFWRVLRDQPDALARACLLTPHSRAELRASSDRPDDLDDVETARRVWVRLTQARAASLRTDKGAGWRFVRGAGTRMSLARYLDGYVARMLPVAERLRSVSLECMPALHLIESYGSSPDVCLYVDPPYLGQLRHARLYQHEMLDVAQHEQLLDALQRCAAAVVLSGYAHPLYDDRLTGWTRHEYAALAQTVEARTEVLWINRAAREVLF